VIPAIIFGIRANLLRSITRHTEVWHGTLSGRVECTLPLQRQRLGRIAKYGDRFVHGDSALGERSAGRACGGADATA